MQKKSLTKPITSFQKMVYEATRKIPQGKVATYRQVASLIGNHKSARAVGNVLNKNPFSYIPCHRVVRCDGKIGGYVRGASQKMKRLRKDGIGDIHNGFINLARYQYDYRRRPDIKSR